MTRRVLQPALLFLLPAVCFLGGCSNSRPSACSRDDLTAFFSGPSAQRLQALSACQPDTAAYNREFQSYRDTARLGTIREVLTDSVGMPFHLGYVTPKALRPGARYPLFIYLHGGIGTERIDKGDSAFLMLEALADTMDLFLASPSANRYAPWWSPYGLSRILQTLRYMALRYPIDPDRVFLAGVSDGATGCYAAANAIPGPFAGFIAVSGFGGMLPMLGVPLIPTNLTQRPIYNVNAGLDRIYPVEQVRQFVAALQEQGVPITAQWYPEEQHGFDYRAREMGALAGFARTWKRTAPAIVSWTFIPGCPNLPAGLAGWTLSSDTAYVQALWRNDTLLVRSLGVESFTLIAPDTRAGTPVICRFPEDKNREKKISPVKKCWPDQLRLLIAGCYPAFTPATFYRISTR